MQQNSISKYFINTEEEVIYSIGYNETKDKLSPSALLITKNYIYIIGKFLFRDNKMLFSETKGLKVIDLKSITAVTEIRKKYPILSFLSVVFFLVSVILFIAQKSIPSFEHSTTSSAYMLLLLMAFIFITIYLLLTQRMLCIEFCGGDLLYDLNYHKLDVTLDIIKNIFNNKKAS